VVAGAFEKEARWHGAEKKRGGWCGRVRVEAREGGEGVWRSVARGGRQQGRAAGVGDAGNRVSTPDGRDRGEAGPDGSGWGVREKRESEIGRRWGTDMRARAAQCRVARFKPDLK
jgi:hypothetical protein